MYKTHFLKPSIQMVSQYKLKFYSAIKITNSAITK